MSLSEAVPPDYAGITIRLRPFEEVVRKRPEMLFAADRGDMALAGQVARAVIADALDWPNSEPITAQVWVKADLRFTIHDDGPVLSLGSGPGQVPDLLLDPRRWSLRAAAALSSRVSIEIHTSDRIWRQTLSGVTPLTPPREAGPAADQDIPKTGRGTRITFQLDPNYFPAGTALPGRDTLTADHQARPLATGANILTVTDHRHPPPT
ncbi:MAG: hypothetical protein ACJ73S_25940 [Mycobacteriales bacterium]